MKKFEEKRKRIERTAAQDGKCTNVSEC